jgi:hypothetical protein
MDSRFTTVSDALLAEGYRVRFRASGASMEPSIGAGDRITIGPIAIARLSPGTVVAYRHLDRLFVHRVVSVGIDVAGRHRVLLRGDALDACDPPISPTQIVGEVVDVRRLSGTRRLGDVARIVRRILVNWRRAGVVGLFPQRAL